MKIKTIPSNRFAVLIPSKGRPEELRKTLEAQPFLNRPNTFIGIEEEERKKYLKVRLAFPHIIWITYINGVQSGTFAREMLRREAVRVGFSRYVVTDDNTRYTETSLLSLVRASLIYPVQPCIIAGMHGTAEHFDSGRIKGTMEVHRGLRFYKKRSAMFWVLPHSFYSKMRYIIDEGCMDDVQVTFAAFRMGITNQMVCMDAPFSKARYKPGGYGTISERVRKVGIAIQRFAKYYPEYMGKVRVTFPWTQIEKSLEGDR